MVALRQADQSFKEPYPLKNIFEIEGKPEHKKGL
jgi:hypothetical protein